MKIQKLLITSAVLTSAVTNIATAEIDECSQHYLDRSLTYVHQQVAEPSVKTEVENTKQQFSESEEQNQEKINVCFLEDVFSEYAKNLDLTEFWNGKVWGKSF